MCGIAGVAGGDPRGRAREVAGMVAALTHRGPDGESVVAGPGSHLGCARLAIRGGAEGAQPIAAGRGLLVFNGEIYNVPELVKDLAWHGLHVSGTSDTAVVAALLSVYGIDAVDRLNGMYALAWDDGETVRLARDPVGQKPLHYRIDGDRARFASEIAPLLPPRPSLHGPAMARWLTFHAAWGEETMFAGVRRVPPGGVVSLPSGRVERATDPAIRFGAPNPSLDEGRLRKVLRRAIDDAEPEEPYGVALSGGLDSSLVAALAGGERTAFHGRVAAQECDESRYARAAAAELGIRLVEVAVDADGCLRALPEVVRALEEPVAGPGSLGQWLVAERAAGDVRILLSGCGGDELFGGYARAAALVRDEPPEGLRAYAPLFARVRGLPARERILPLLDRRAPALYRREFLDAHPAPGEEFRERFLEPGLDPLAAAARAEIAIVLPALLQVEDRVAMAFGVETRAPLLDRRLLRTAARLAPGGRVDGDGRPKALLARAAHPLLPAAVRGRRDKMGFPLPVGEWMRGPWRGFVREALLDARTRERGWLRPEGVEEALSSSGRYDRGLVSALLLELWARSFLDG